ncbi:hypothetical protein FGO68_gene1923 [Halteria grandinella]|uniref:GPI ethanolamine phosphate transferase 3 n=1 Tax=Halteria grandinella TaxID=5974 RepID=A0A8J8T7S7_HALGN|nr:hypothetical protein FGO68_gene1923 [Halteria grandinella]
MANSIQHEQIDAHIPQEPQAEREQQKWYQKAWKIATFQYRPQFRYVLSLIILFLIAETYFSSSIFLNKRVITQKSERFSEEYYHTSPVKPKKLIMLLVDALREDFVEMDESLIPVQYLDHNNSIYTRRRIQLFNDLLKEQPENTILAPMKVEMPTVTAIRIQGTMTGALNSYIEIKDNFGSQTIEEDSLLYQINNRGYKRTKDRKPLDEYIVFTGDYIWSDEFAPYFNRSFPHSSFNVQDLDSHDNATSRDLRREVKDMNFTLLLGHLIGVDHGGHSGGANNKQIERKLRETETLIKDMIELMDNDTVIMVYGDHGMNNEGHHGGNSLQELRSAFFAYTKGGFPFKKATKEIQEHFNELQSDIKQLDLPSIATAILDLPIPFSNVGVLYPSLYMLNDIKQLYKRMLMQMEQLSLYVQAYCNESHDYWCKHKVIDMKVALQDFTKLDLDSMPEAQIAEKIKEIHQYMYSEYESFSGLWIQFKIGKIIFSLTIITILLAEVTINFLTEKFQLTASPIMFIVRVILYVVIACIPEPFNPVSIVSVCIIVLTFAYGIVKNKKVNLLSQIPSLPAIPTLISSQLLIPTLLTLFGIAIQSYSCFEEYMMQEFDTAGEAIMVSIFITLWMIQGREIRYNLKVLSSLAMIVLCMKLAYFFDQDHSVNFELEEPFKTWKHVLQNTQWFASYMPLVLYLAIEAHILNDIYSNYCTFSRTSRPRISLTLRLSISAALLSVTAYVWSQDPNEHDSNARRNAAAKFVYIASLLHMIFELVYKSTYQTLMEFFTKVALIMVKPVMIVNGLQSTLTIVLLIVQLLSIKSFATQMKLRPHILTYATLIYFTLLQYFYRTGHRERISSIQFQKAFLGFPQYNYFINGFLVTLNTFASHVVGFLLLPYLGNISSQMSVDEEAGKSFTTQPLYHGQRLYKYLVFLSLFLFEFSAIHASRSIDSVFFPERFAPKTIFDVLFSMLYVGFAGVFFLSEERFFYGDRSYQEEKEIGQLQQDVVEITTGPNEEGYGKQEMASPFSINEQ